MHPAASVILFTTASGAGYGLFAWLGLAVAAGLLPADPLFGFVALGLATALVTIGLLSSTIHLGRPERAWRALSQWRSSWLSREGVAAILTYIPAVVVAIGWILLRRLDGILSVAGFALAVFAAITVVCTGMIYQSLKPIRQWNNSLTTPVYLALAAYTGGLLFVGVTLGFSTFHPVYAAFSLALLAAAAAVKAAYWRNIDREPERSDMRSATGLQQFSSVRLFEAPHTEENFIMREMGFAIARKHAAKLRAICWLTLFGAPALALLGLALLAATGGLAPTLASLFAAVSAAVGVGVERWLFFAEATHVSMLYYQRRA